VEYPFNESDYEQFTVLLPLLCLTVFFLSHHIETPLRKALLETAFLLSNTSIFMIYNL